MKYLSLKSLFALFLFVLSSASALAGGGAGGILVHVPVAPASIPTLSGTMLFVLSLLLIAVSFRMAKQKNAGAKHFIIVLGVGALISAGGGVKLISDAQAVNMQTMVATGGSLPIIANDLNTYNNPGVPQRITQKILPTGSPPVAESVNAATAACPDTNPPGAGLTQCTVGLVVPTGGACSIDCTFFSGSDIRLKRDIHYLTELKNGLKLYSFKYINSFDATGATYVGVMAQDLLKHTSYKHSVRLMNNNYYGVNYSSLGLKMITLDQWKKLPKSIFIES